MPTARVQAILLTLMALAATGAVSCRRHTPTPQDSAPILEHALAGPGPGGVAPDAWKDVRAFYARAGGGAVWTSGAKPSNRAADALNVLGSARSHGLVSADYGDQDLAAQMESLLASSGKNSNADAQLQQAVEFDVRLTTALLSLGRDVAVGRGDPASLEPTWKKRRPTPDLPGTLARALDGGLDQWLDQVRPTHPEYAALQQALVATYALKDAGGWSEVPLKTLKPSRSDPAVVALRRRLAVSGELAGGSTTTESPIYDDELTRAIRTFQDHHALTATGIADEPTITAMNVPIEARIKQMAASLERWRWLPDDFGPRYLLVNVPAYHVIAREHGQTVKDIRVIVGKPDDRTPVFSAQMTTVIFSPYWRIPDTIAKGETVPAIARNPNYLATNGIEILRLSKSGATVVNPSTVHWNDPNEVNQLAFRQKPGPKNAMGHVTFLLPNPFEVYLHDTPADALFAQPGRALSHGCIRVEEPFELAKYVLQGDPEWDDARIAAAMHAGVEKRVALKEEIPVHIVYFTAWVDDQGGLRLYPDIYGYDGTSLETAGPSNGK